MGNRKDTCWLMEAQYQPLAWGHSVCNGLKSVLSVVGRVLGESCSRGHSTDLCFLGEKWTVGGCFSSMVYNLWISFLHPVIEAPWRKAGVHLASSPIPIMPSLLGMQLQVLPLATPSTAVLGLQPSTVCPVLEILWVACDMCPRGGGGCCPCAIGNTVPHCKLRPEWWHMPTVSALR